METKHLAMKIFIIDFSSDNKIELKIDGVKVYSTGNQEYSIFCNF